MLYGTRTVIKVDSSHRPRASLPSWESLRVSETVRPLPRLLVLIPVGDPKEGGHERTDTHRLLQHPGRVRLLLQFLPQPDLPGRQALAHQRALLPGDEVRRH